MVKVSVESAYHWVMAMQGSPSTHRHHHKWKHPTDFDDFDNFEKRGAVEARGGKVSLNGGERMLPLSSRNKYKQQQY